MRKLISLNLEREQTSTGELLEQVKPKKAVRIKKTQQSPQEKLTQKIQLAKENTATMSSIGLRLIQTEADLDCYFEAIYKKGVVAIDTETGGFNCYLDGLAGICLYTPGEDSVYIPTGHTDIYDNLLDTNLCLTDQVCEKFIKMLTDPQLKHIYHHAKFDMKFLYTTFGALPLCYWDTQVAGHLLNENEPHGLKPLWMKYCTKGEENAEKFSDLFVKIKFMYVPIECAYLYAAKDAKMTYELYHFQAQYLNETGKLKKVYQLYREVEIPVITTLANMELRGVQLDADFAKQLKIDYTAKLKEVESYIYQFIYSHDLTCLDETVLKKLDDPINLGSSTQMAIIFYDLLKLPIVSRDKPRSTASEILDELIIKLNPVQKLNEVVAFLENLKQHRGLNKLLSGFIESLPQQVCPVTNKIHAKNNATGTVTGRMSMSEPNLQQIPSKNKDIRKLFVADKDHLLIGLDYSQEEPRILAHLSQDKHLLDTYSKGIDIYAQSASLTFNIPYDECKEFDAEGRLNPEGKKRRNSMKSVILGKMYGRGPKSIAEQLGIKAKEAQVIVDNFDMTFPGVKKLIDKECAFASAYGYVETVYGRKRRLPDMQLENSAYNDKRIRKASRQVLNSIIQGTGGDIVKKALIALDNDTFLNEKGYQLLFSVHDEILGQAPEDVALECARRMKEIMIQVPSDRILVPFKVDGEIMRRWTDENLLEVWGETL